ncbi:ribosomal protein L13e [Vulcanisaeta distributa]|uniref:ribosomal protein L13e n=1 Tax=Vulcanisaeta distributa TaxID=164451 RepID=UPI001FB49121|nr:ribosomal protein L13e [Vulcanisaeta distributa]
MEVGRGYSIGEVRAVGLTPGEARLLGIRIDTNRDTVWDVNVQRLRDWLNKVIKGEVLPPELHCLRPLRLSVRRVGYSGH